jgi:molybdopterin synthase sulfur carrier subunit
MARIFIPSQLRDLTEGLAEINLEGSTLREVIEALEMRFPGVKARICDGQQLLPGLQVSINHVSTRAMSAMIKPESEVHFLPAIGGG